MHLWSVSLMFWRDEKDFSPSELLEAERPASNGQTTLLLVVAATIIGLALGTTIVRLDVVVDGRGTLVPVNASQIVATPEEATVEHIEVREGQSVKKGEILAIFSSEAARETLMRAESDAKALRAEVGWLEQMVASPLAAKAGREIAENSNSFGEASAIRSSLNARVRQADTEVSQAENRIVMLQRSLDEAVALKSLAEQKAAQDAELRRVGFRAQASVSDEQISLRRAIQELVRARMDLDTERRVKERAVAQRSMVVDEVMRELQGRLSTKRVALAEAESQLREAHGRNDRLTVVSNGDGVVDFADTQSYKRRVDRNTVIARVVPARSERLLRVALQDRDVSLVKTGQISRITLSGGENQGMRDIPGKVVSVSRENISYEGKTANVGDPTNPLQNKFFNATVALLQNNASLPSGINATVKIVVGSRTIFDHLFSFSSTRVSELKSRGD